MLAQLEHPGSSSGLAGVALSINTSFRTWTSPRWLNGTCPVKASCQCCCHHPLNLYQIHNLPLWSKRSHKHLRFKLQAEYQTYLPYQGHRHHLHRYAHHAPPVSPEPKLPLDSGIWHIRFLLTAHRTEKFSPVVVVLKVIVACSRLAFPKSVSMGTPVSDTRMLACKWSDWKNTVDCEGNSSHPLEVTMYLALLSDRFKKNTQQWLSKGQATHNIVFMQIHQSLTYWSALDGHHNHMCQTGDPRDIFRGEPSIPLKSDWWMDVSPKRRWGCHSLSTQISLPNHHGTLLFLEALQYFHACIWTMCRVLLLRATWQGLRAHLTYNIAHTFRYFPVWSWVLCSRNILIATLVWLWSLPEKTFAKPPPKTGYTELAERSNLEDRFSQPCPSSREMTSEYDYQIPWYEQWITPASR